MKISVRETLSLVIGLSGVALLGIGVSKLLDTGTCGSGGPHVIARECPKGSGVWGVLLMVGFFMWLIGPFVSKANITKPGAGRVVWTVGFTGGGIALLIKGWTNPTLSADSYLAIYLMAGIFIPMGIAIWIPTLLRLRRAWRAGPATATAPGTETASPKADAGPTSGVSDRRARMKQLNRLRSSGALTRAEFDQLKRDQAGPLADDRQEPSRDRLALIQQLAGLKASGILSAEEFEAKKQTIMLSEAVG
ncbi:SHOCT domain-containing protein [Dactylosporangium sp. McL0621]|uniref:SHOCT domain-containing protein n=1 Tax=Dactylosporangium sp. McL0621 TaxID=3415678 RepID=UPI003CF3B54C